MNQNTMNNNENMNATATATVEAGNEIVSEMLNATVAEHDAKLTSIIVATIRYTAKRLDKEHKKGKFKFDNVIQRFFVWDNEKKSNLIHSMIEGYPIPAVYARRFKDSKIFDVLDGKQRLLTILNFINGNFKLSDMPEITYENDEGEIVTIDTNGMCFDDLPTELQDKILDYNLTINYIEEISDNQISILFRKLNNGKPLSTKDKNIASCVDIKKVAEIGEHEIFSLILTESGMNNRKQIPIVMKLNEMMTKDVDDISFESKVFNEVIRNTTIADETRQRMESVFEYFLSIWNCMDDTFTANVSKRLHGKMKQETHFVSFFPFYEMALNNECDVRKFANFIAYFFGGKNYKSISVGYNDSCACGGAKNCNIVYRHQEIEIAYNKYMDEHKDEFAENPILVWEGLPESDDDAENAENEQDVNVETVDNGSLDNESSEQGQNVETVEAVDVEMVEIVDDDNNVFESDNAIDAEYNEVADADGNNDMSSEMVELMDMLNVV